MDHSLTKLRQIIQKSSSTTSVAKQMEVVVTSVRETMQVHVCSLYLLDNDNLLTLVATDGLNPQSVGRVRLPFGQGLVGTVAESNQPLNVAEASRHPAFRFFSETEEEKVSSFLGVPLVHMGQTIGVLVVQEITHRRFSDEEESFLLTVGSQLAGTLYHLKDEISFVEAASRVAQNLRAKGVKGAGGIGIGIVHWIGPNELPHVSDREVTDVDAEIAHFRSSVAAILGELEQFSSDLEGEVTKDIASIFSVYELCLQDGELIDGVEEGIRERNWAPGALRNTVMELSARFESMEDPYLRARGEDIRHLGNRIYEKLRGGSRIPQPAGEEKLVIAGDMVSITDIARIGPERIAGIFCTEGSTLSHTAILAGALGFPAVMGVGHIHRITDQSLAIIDGNQAHVIFNPTDSLLEAYRQVLLREHTLAANLRQLKELPAVTPDGHRVALLANTGLLADLSPGLEHGAEGIGLYRSEIPFMIRENFPSEEEQINVYRNALVAYSGKPVCIRTLDIGADKPLPYFSFREENPSLGWRGIRFSLDNKPIFITQVRAMLKASEGFNNLSILLPMISRLDEIDQFLELLQNVITGLRNEGRTIQKPRVGIMLEVPSIIPLLGFLKKRVDFISIGSNDLAQYLLAVDRNNPRVARMYHQLHPALIHEIDHILSTSRELDLPVSVCGEMAADPLAVVLLLGMGVDTLSMNARNLPRIKWLIRTIPKADAQAVVAGALCLESEQEIQELVTGVIRDHGLSELVD